MPPSPTLRKDPQRIMIDQVEPPNPSPVVAYDVIYELDPTSEPPLFRKSPWRLLGLDALFILKHAVMIPYIFLPLGAASSDIRLVGLAVQVFLLAASVALTILVIPSLTIGVPSPALVGVAVGGFIWFGLGAQGDMVRQSKGDVELAKRSEKEAWFCVNGIGTTASGAQLIANRLHALFHRRVTVVLNRSLGLWFDLIECMLQRDLVLTTSDIRVGYKQVRAAVMDPKIERVVIVGHSQGGIIVSAWADQLLSDFPHDMLAKVEFYTFASAANHFSNPVSPPTSEAPVSTPPFAHVEHFGNDGDFVACLGVLGTSLKVGGVGANEEMAATKATLDRAESAVLSRGKQSVIPRLKGSFGGRVFKRLHHTGHLLNAHYLNPRECILEDPVVRANSNLVTYLGGGNPVRGRKVANGSRSSAKGQHS